MNLVKFGLILQVHAELEKRHSVEEMESKGFISNFPFRSILCL